MHTVCGHQRACSVSMAAGQRGIRQSSSGPKMSVHLCLGIFRRRCAACAVHTATCVLAVAPKQWENRADIALAAGYVYSPGLFDPTWRLHKGTCMVHKSNVPLRDCTNIRL